MDSEQSAKLDNTYDKCKLVVKQWENAFKKTSGRLPSKLDIREANKEVRNAYKTYFKLKTAALEESLTNIAGFEVDIDETEHVYKDDLQCERNSVNGNVELSNKVNTKDTWGSHLSNLSKNKKDKVNQKTENSNVNLSFTNKLFQGSKSSKRLPRKSLSFNRKKSDLDCSKFKFSSQPDSLSTFSQEIDKTCSDLNSDSSEETSNVKIINAVRTILSQPVNILQNAFNSNYQDKPLRVVDQGWIERIGDDSKHKSDDLLCKSDDETKTSTTKVNYDSDYIIDNSDDDCENSCSLYHIAKKRKVSGVNSSGNESKEQLDNSGNNLVTVDVMTKRTDFSNIFNNKLKTKETSETNDSNIHSLKQFQTDVSNELRIKNSRENVRKSERLRITVTDGEQLCTENDNPFHSNDNSRDKDFIPEESPKQSTNITNVTVNKKKRERSTRKQKLTKNKPDTNIENSIQKTYELEYSVKPRIITVPRMNNIKQVISKKKRQTSVRNDKEEQATTELPNNQVRKEAQKLQQKINSGTLNDNFVQINLKKKIFVRGHKKKSFASYKKQMWKNKKKALCGPDMDMSGCDGGMLTCFTCGKVGHFARACKLSKGDELRPLEDDTEECIYPTLEEAAQMAKESALTIRKPNSNLNAEDNNTENAELNQLTDEDDAELLAEVERLETEIAKIDVQRYIDTTTYIKPYYNLGTDDSIIDTPQEVFDALQLFGHQTFRTGQEQAIMRILSGRSTLLTLSTGSGKSLCYQLPAYLYSKRDRCISLIISPLVSLMEDQVTGIPMFLKAACLHTNQTKTQKEKVLDAIKTGSLNILLVSPEAVVCGEKSSGFGSILRKLPPIAFACIDEVHCVSHWSHNFRPSYLKICKVLKDRLGVGTILGLTATATRATCDSVIEHLSIPDGRCGHISDIPLPTNLRLLVSRDEHRDQALLGLILSEPYASYRSIIIYCTRREECERVAMFLRTCLKDEHKPNSKKRKRFSLQAEYYHAGMSASRRKSIQKSFMSGELRIVVATVAFGMGINKADIRSVIHYNMPMTFENYVQEVGRAGRDGLPAQCHLFLDAQGKDENELRRHIYANSTDRRVIRKLLERCFVPCSCKSVCPRHEVAFSIEQTVLALDIPEENIETLLCYLELHDKHYIELLSHAYVKCSVISYGGPNEITKAAKQCAPLAMAIALFKKEENVPNTVFEFPVVEVAAVMGWDSGICKHILKNLEWTSKNNQPKRSNLTVQFSNLGFRLLSPGNLPDSELDAALDNLYNRVIEQEQMSLLQLHAVHATLISVTAHSFKKCLLENENNDKELLLKTKIREYFESPKPLDEISEINTLPVDEDHIRSDVRSLVHMYKDNSFTGRAVARIFHGIQSPNYPAFIWGRCKFWRLHIGTDFNAICKISAEEIYGTVK